MNNAGLETSIQNEIMALVDDRKSLMLSSLDEEGLPYASYAPFAFDERHLYVLISDIAVHGRNLRANPQASVLIIEDESSAAELFARVRVFYRVRASLLAPDSADWQTGIRVLQARHGQRIESLSQLSDFRLFRLQPEGGRYVKGFGKAYQIEGGSLAGESLQHLREGHKKRN
ncbi:Pyridoxamine 5'-phosphate oxidase-like protein [Methylophaga frappieri]|uniref:Pyridoxamine 5'-phosphate oxidase-like protein n=1 Tax=Methylophaga frappieri (strain ATCC BAA-2434 / DSM 25690 / JAM7) TaxID=754477 RepID=I1YIZ7_METFJ|nr:pyridoxamine 5'-phosphate oxidase family protein [Methylophaga frappieri]AFJ02890.1 Pyridoxamine 5'-phosphate oxidase-like protein [Methylophaga frappieri]